MSERLSFFVKRESALHRLNPLTKLSIVFAFIFLTFLSPFRWLAPALAIPVILLSFIGGVQRQFLNVALKLILPAISFMFVMQSIFLPGGETVLFAVWIFDVTLETVEKAFITVSRIFVMISSFAILLLTTHPSELMSDLTRRGLPGTIRLRYHFHAADHPADASQSTDHHRCPTLTRAGYRIHFQQASRRISAVGRAIGIWFVGGSGRTRYRYRSARLHIHTHENIPV